MSKSRYRCIHCDHLFEVEGDGEAGTELRCPKCHRVHDQVPVPETAGVPWFKRNTVVGGAALVLLAGAAVLVYVLRAGSGGDGEPEQPRIPAASSAEVQALVARVPGTAGADLLLGKAAGTAAARARALGAVLRALVDQKLLAVQDIEAPMDLADRPLLDPVPLLERLGQGPPVATSLEAALLALRMARATGLAADVVRVERYGRAKVPADPSGLFGHFAVAVKDGATTVYIDPLQPDGVAAEAAEAAVVPDAACGGILEAYRGLKAFLPRRDRPRPDRMAASQHLDKAKSLAGDQTAVRMALAFTSVQEAPGDAFAQCEAVLKSATPSERVAVAEVYATLGRTAEVERLLAEAEQAYPAWARIPLVRGQIALGRAGLLAMAAMARAHPGAMPPQAEAQMKEQLQRLGLSESDSPEDHFVVLRRQLEAAEKLGGGRGVARLREMYAIAAFDYHLAQGDLDGARALLEESARVNPDSPETALPLAGILLATGDEEGARRVLEPTTEKAGGTLEQMMGAARALGDRIRQQLQLATSPPQRPFDLSTPGAMGLPSTEPSLQMPSLGGSRPGGLGQGLQLRF
ncbi:MAG: tetratricopeptide repeat protein [Deltaproteobacteria bacterium]|nr:tetratricopeptide repeat protein [Deltaproteobacteria bacterium]